MCDTLNSNHVISSHDKITNLNKKCESVKTPRQLSTKANICEPDNGHTEVVNKLNLQIESERLKTFKNWKNEAVTPEKLAEAGFYYWSGDDVVRCAFCNTEVCRWAPGDNPMDEHAKWSPSCPFLKERRTSIGLPRGEDICGNQELYPNSMPEDETFRLLRKSDLPDTFESRLATFEDWPKSLRQKPRKLAEAGFFYKGVGDQTLCYHCGGGLKDWEDDDEPWEQHALWFPQCNFLLLSKGQEFIEQIQSRLKSEEHSVPSSSKSPTKEESVKNKCEQVANTPEDDDSTKLCKICYKNDKAVVFIPCGHFLACVECSLSVKNVCPICRKRFERAIRVFPS